MGNFSQAPKAVANGFANRFLWVCARRSKYLPEGGALKVEDLEPLIERLRLVVQFARTLGELRRDEQARAVWSEVYAQLSDGKPGLLGTVTSRGDPQTMRLACLYALLDCSTEIRAKHLLAALALWRYCEDSAAYIFGDSLGDATADEILRTLRDRGESGLTREDLYEHFGRHKRSSEISRALAVLASHGLARSVREQTGGRPAERWFAV